MLGNSFWNLVYRNITRLIVVWIFLMPIYMYIKSQSDSYLSHVQSHILVLSKQCVFWRLYKCVVWAQVCSDVILLSDRRVSAEICSTDFTTGCLLHVPPNVCLCVCVERAKEEGASFFHQDCFSASFLF